MSVAPPDVETLADGIRAGDRGALARGITLVESSRAQDRPRARALVSSLRERTGAATRVGVSGVPGVGKSTFIEALGGLLVDSGRRVAVLAVDPTSTRSGGSILGDKTRMERLAHHPGAFIRPSPSRGALGGVAAATREAIMLCEAAGFDVILVETVGVGQSEVMVSELVDCFLVLMLANAGDELQGIKRGILELVDVLVINKADGDQLAAAKLAAGDYRRALQLMPPRTPDWTVPVQTCSALQGVDIDEVWAAVVRHRAHLEEDNRLATQRRRQAVTSTHRMLEAELLRALQEDPEAAARMRTQLAAVEDGALSPADAVEEILAAFLRR